MLGPAEEEGRVRKWCGVREKSYGQAPCHPIRSRPFPSLPKEEASGVARLCVLRMAWESSATSLDRDMPWPLSSFSLSDSFIYFTSATTLPFSSSVPSPFPGTPLSINPPCSLEPTPCRLPKTNFFVFCVRPRRQSMTKEQPRSLEQTSGTQAHWEPSSCLPPLPFPARFPQPLCYRRRLLPHDFLALPIANAPFSVSHALPSFMHVLRALLPLLPHTSLPFPPL